MATNATLAAVAIMAALTLWPTCSAQAQTPGSELQSINREATVPLLSQCCGNAKLIRAMSKPGRSIFNT